MTERLRCFGWSSTKWTIGSRRRAAFAGCSKRSQQSSLDTPSRLPWGRLSHGEQLGLPREPSRPYAKAKLLVDMVLVVTSRTRDSRGTVEWNDGAFRSKTNRSKLNGGYYRHVGCAQLGAASTSVWLDTIGKIARAGLGIATIDAKHGSAPRPRHRRWWNRSARTALRCV